MGSRKKLRIFVVLGVLTAGTVALFGAAYLLSNMLLFRGRTKAEWTLPNVAQCRPWLKDVAFADLRPGKAPGTPLDQTCEQAMSLPGQDARVLAKNGLAIRYRIFENPIPPSARDASQNPVPMWLHVHGHNGNVLHGGRYFHAASRLGFQLVAMELSNHGSSEYNGQGAAWGCREKDDVLAVFSDLQLRFPDRSIFITASSMGTMALINAMEELRERDTFRHLVAVGLENPIIGVRELVTSSPQAPRLPTPLLDLSLWVAEKRSGYDFDNCAPLPHVKHFRVPTVVHYSEKDDTVTKEHAVRTFENLPEDVPKALKVYPNGGHSAVWNGQPEIFEADLRSIWQSGLAYRGEFLIGKAK